LLGYFVPFEALDICVFNVVFVKLVEEFREGHETPMPFLFVVSFSIGFHVVWLAKAEFCGVCS
jgi:hypothetical protein